MNSQEKIEQITRIISAQENNLCPYCFNPFEKYTHKDGSTREACYNHDEGDLEIELVDYYNNIVNIIKYGELKIITKYRSFDSY